MSVLRILSAVGAITLPSFMVQNGHSDIELSLKYKEGDIESKRAELDMELALRKLEFEHEEQLEALAQERSKREFELQLDAQEFKARTEIILREHETKIKLQELELNFRVERVRAEQEAELQEFKAKVARSLIALNTDESAPSREIEHLRAQLELTQALLSQEREHIADLKSFAQALHIGSRQ
jgi:hypothetical protein